MNVAMRTVLSPVLPLIEDEFHVTHAQAGSIFTFMAIGYGVSMLFAGLFASRIGCKKTVLLSLLLALIVYLLWPFAREFNLFHALGFALGMASGMYLPAIIPLITEYFEERMWGKAIAIHESAASLAMFSSPFIALLVLSFSSWRGIFGLFAAIFVVCMIAFYFLVQEVKPLEAKKGSLPALLRDRSLWLMGIIWIFMAGAYVGFYFIIPLYLVREVSLDVETANSVFGFSRLGGVIVQVLIGFVINRFSLKKVMFVFMLLSGIFTMLLTINDLAWLKVFLFAQASFNMGFFSISLIAISRMFERETRGAAMGFIITLGVVCGNGITPYLLGLSGDLISFRFGIFILGLLGALSSGLVWFLKRLR
jgi:NNP family nitrate/nitrite transporter-like MFS transporter